MESKALGRLQVSAVGLGCNNFGMRLDAAATDRVVAAALEAGITYFDTAESYGDGLSEEYLGRALGRHRSEVAIATKWGHTKSLAPDERAGDPIRIRARLEDSLTRLGTDYVDHYQLHRADPETPVEETLGGLAALRDEGKIIEIGCTHFSADALTRCHDAAIGNDFPPFASVQDHYSLLTRDPETNGVFSVCEQIGIAFVPYFPLESGLLTGKYRMGKDRPEDSRLATWGDRANEFIDDDKLTVVERLIVWAESRGRSLLELAMSWHTSHPLVASVIAGATTPAQVAANVAATSWVLSADDRVEIDAAIRGDGEPQRMTPSGRLVGVQGQNELFPHPKGQAS